MYERLRYERASVDIIIGIGMEDPALPTPNQDDDPDRIDDIV